MLEKKDITFRFFRLKSMKNINIQEKYDSNIL